MYIWILNCLHTHTLTLVCLLLIYSISWLTQSFSFFFISIFHIHTNQLNKYKPPKITLFLSLALSLSHTSSLNFCTIHTFSCFQIHIQITNRKLSPTTNHNKLNFRLSNTRAHSTNHRRIRMNLKPKWHRQRHQYRHHHLHHHHHHLLLLPLHLLSC